MEKNDRQGLSEALTAASKMLEDDKAKLDQDDQDIQNFTRGSMAYGYSSRSAKYPEVSKVVQVELEKAVGDETAVTPEIKNRTVATLKELEQAIK